MQTRSSDENSVCLFVCPSVKRVHCDKTKERSVQIFIPHQRPYFSLVSWEEEWLVGATSSTWNFGCTNQSIIQFISRHSTDARATVLLCRIKEKCLETDLKCVNGWNSSTVQWKGVPKSRSSSVQVVRRKWQKLLCGWSQQTRLTVWADQIRWLLERSNQITKFGEFELDLLPDWQAVQAP